MYSDSFGWNHFSLAVIIWKGPLASPPSCGALLFSCQVRVLSLGPGPLGAGWVGNARALPGRKMERSLGFWMFPSNAVPMAVSRAFEFMGGFHPSATEGGGPSDSPLLQRKTLKLRGGGERGRRKTEMERARLLSPGVYRLLPRALITPPSDSNEQASCAHFTAEKTETRGGDRARQKSARPQVTPGPSHGRLTHRTASKRLS